MKSAAISTDEVYFRSDERQGANMSDELEVRVARIESDVQHIKADTSDLRVELRRTNDKIDALATRFDNKIDASTTKLDNKIDASTTKLDNKIDALKDKLNSMTVWALLLYLALAGSLLTVMAKGFKWI